MWKALMGINVTATKVSPQVWRGIWTVQQLGQVQDIPVCGLNKQG